MRLNKALTNEKVALCGQLIYMELCAGRKYTHICELTWLKGIVDGDLLVINDVVSEHSALLFLSSCPVKTRGNKNCYIRIGASLSYLSQFKRQRYLAGHSPCVITGYDDHLLFPLGKLA